MVSRITLICVNFYVLHVFFLSLWVYGNKQSFINSWILDQILKGSAKAKLEKAMPILACCGFKEKVDCYRSSENHTDVIISTSTTEAVSYSSPSYWKLIFSFLGLSLGGFVDKLSFREMMVRAIQWVKTVQGSGFWIGYLCASRAPAVKIRVVVILHLRKTLLRNWKRDQKLL